ncbi:MAG: signal recognition particle protein [Simkaniaceae bacterium]|nr:signal recognition particle protein [Candidatus Sacchlamyda saccharinae]
MFDSVANKFTQLFSSLAGKKQLTEENLSDAVRKVRLALLDADVNYSVASQFVKRVKEKVLGADVIKSVKPDQQFIKVVHEELVALMGAEEPSLQLNASPAVFLMCGLQGAGKTTMTAKLAAHLKKQNKKVLVAACDLQRPAAVEQLKRVCAQSETDVVAVDGENKPLKVAKEALARARKEGYDVLLVDTAGRLHIDAPLMDELKDLKKALNPQEILFVANATTGQDAVKTAQEFDGALGITGSILTMLDGSARAGAALSITEVTKKPLKFEGIGEHIDDIQVFNPKSMADRVLGMGDVVNLVKKAEEHFSEEESEKLEKKLRKASFTYNDYLKQMGMMKKMGSMKSLLKMVPGMSNLGDLDISEKEFQKTEAIIQSMTSSERGETVELVPSRRRRIAKGSGTSIDDVNRLVKGFKKLKKLCKSMPKMGSMADMKMSKEMLWQ